MKCTFYNTLHWRPNDLQVSWSFAMLLVLGNKNCLSMLSWKNKLSHVGIFGKAVFFLLSWSLTGFSALILLLWLNAGNSATSIVNGSLPLPVCTPTVLLLFPQYVLTPCASSIFIKPPIFLNSPPSHSPFPPSHSPFYSLKTPYQLLTQHPTRLFSLSTIFSFSPTVILLLAASDPGCFWSWLPTATRSPLGLLGLLLRPSMSPP